MSYKVQKIKILGFDWFQVVEGTKVLHQFPNEVYAARRVSELEHKKTLHGKPVIKSDDKLAYYWLKSA